jgi:PRTRC genetic system ThiF family protein
MKNLPPIHFVAQYLLNPTNPVFVNLIGAGGTGSQVLTALARINHSLHALQHPGLQVTLYDDDVITPANLGRQLFPAAELGYNKAVALINRVNRFFGTGWKAIDEKYQQQTHQPASITISCVDKAITRFEIAATLQKFTPDRHAEQKRSLYWMDFGNSQYTGQVLLSTVGKIEQPKSKKFMPVAELPFITEEFKSLLSAADKDDSGPSCSLAEALLKQDLFINSALANTGASLLWTMFREGMITNRGLFMNLKEFRTQSITVASAVKRK